MEQWVQSNAGEKFKKKKKIVEASLNSVAVVIKK